MRFALSLFAFASLLTCLCTCSSCTKRAAQNTPTPGATATPDNTGLPQPQDAAGYVALGNELFRRDRDEDAVAAYQQALKLDPANAAANLKLGVTYRVLGQKKESDEAFDKAVKAYEQAVKADAKDATAQLNLAEAYSQTGAYQK